MGREDTNVLEIKNVSVGYGKRAVLDGVSANFERGMLTGVIGVNGAGKSTMLKAMLGILTPTKGNISVDGEDISALGRTAIARKISYLSQGKDTPEMTVMQMVLHGRFPYLSYPRRYSSRDREIALSAIERVGLSDFAQSPLRSLSGGMRQNAYIAMALAQDTDYILLDEPTTYLDISHQIELMKLLRELAQSGKGIVAVMHDLPMAFDFSDKICLLLGSDSAVCATPAELCASGMIEATFGVSLAASEERRYSYVFDRDGSR